MAKPSSLDAKIAEIDAEIARLTEALERFCRKMPLAPRFRALEQARLEVLLAGWLEVEKLREPFTVEEKEQERRVEFGGVRTVVRTDRVDRLQDGGLVLIDYKTNAPSPSAWESERPQEPQLPLYACTLEGRLAAVAFAQVRPGDLRFNGLAEREGVLPQVKEADVDLEQHKRQWSLALDALGEAFRAGQAQVDPRDPGTTCSRCPLPSLCRISEVEGASGF